MNFFLLNTLDQGRRVGCGIGAVVPPEKFKAKTLVFTFVFEAVFITEFYLNMTILLKYRARFGSFKKL